MGKEVQALPDRMIILIGYRCTGKTTVGTRLAARLKLPFVDTDALVEEAVGKPIRSMVEESGWEFFRRQEKETIRNLTARGKSVIATGGGAVMDAENAALLQKNGILIWLTADAGTIRERMLADPASAGQRPRFSHEDLAAEIESTLAVRAPTYRRLADLEIDTAGMGTEACVDLIVEYVHDKYH